MSKVCSLVTCVNVGVLIIIGNLCLTLLNSYSFTIPIVTCKCLKIIICRICSINSCEFSVNKNENSTNQIPLAHSLPSYASVEMWYLLSLEFLSSKCVQVLFIPA